MNPEQMAENLKKANGYVPGIRPGKSTEQYVTKILYRLTFIGAIFRVQFQFYRHSSCKDCRLLPPLHKLVVRLPDHCRCGT
ncbi:hypothetical protein ACT7CZ_00115 [Bacillus cereus]